MTADAQRRLARRRWGALLLGLLASGISAACYPRVIVPSTPEGNACRRECMAISNTCRGADCSRQNRDCLLSCPGAYSEPVKGLFEG